MLVCLGWFSARQRTNDELRKQHSALSHPVARLLLEGCNRLSNMWGESQLATLRQRPQLDCGAGRSSSTLAPSCSKQGRTAPPCQVSPQRQTRRRRRAATA
eukprot:scaffold84903_cov63-Phaeocystis_antarctica.AAC.2